MQKDSAITAIKGIGAKTADSFAKMGVYTVGDILLRFPRTYVQYPKAEPVNAACSKGYNFIIKCTEPNFVTTGRVINGKRN